LIRLFSIPLLFTTFLNADKVLVRTLACKTMDALEKAPVNEEDSMKLNLYAIANECAILSRDAEIQVLGYDPRNTKKMYIQIVDKRTGYNFYILKSKIQIEQGGEEASYRF